MAWQSVQVSADQLVRDEAVIFDLLKSGRLVLSGDVAKVLSIEESVREIRRVGLEKDGVLIRAAFRDRSLRIDKRERGAGRYYDAFYNEVAAFVVSRYLGLNIVPPTVLRSLPISKRGLKSGDKLLPGSLQLWVENSIVEYELEERELDYPGDPDMKYLQLSEIRFFDCIIGNLDRHQGNFLVDFNQRFPGNEQASNTPLVGKLWAIDHTKAFHSGTGVTGEHCKTGKIERYPVSLVFIQRLRTWQLAEIERALRASGLTDKQLSRLNLDQLDRRARKIRSHLEKLQDQSKLNDNEFFSDGAWHEVW